MALAEMIGKMYVINKYTFYPFLVFPTPRLIPSPFSALPLLP
jgi:hypothetical protein